MLGWRISMSASLIISGSYDDLYKVSQLVIEPTQGDLLYAMDLQGQRILDRTAQGIDYTGSPFAEYDKTHPYYYYPAGKGSKGVRYDSYDAFKKSLGRQVVDLMGADAPHMLGVFELQVNGLSFRFNAGEYDAQSAPASTVTMGIYQTKGFLAYLHNEGIAPQPERKFFAISDEDKERIFEDIARRISARVRKTYAY